MSIPTNPTKKQRALPRVWARFFSLSAISMFTHKGKRYVKGILPFCAYHAGQRSFFAPWTRVQTDVLVRDARPGGKSGPLNDGGDDYIVGQHWESTGGTTPEQNEARFGAPAPAFSSYRGPVEQPNSDNNVSGPTS